jgi:Tfp pilus assembly protein PilO
VIANLSRRERSIIVGGVVLAVLIGGWFFIVDPIRERNEITAELVPVREEMLMRRQELVARKGDVTADLRAVEQQIEKLSGRLLTAAAPAVAASELQNLAKEMTAAAKTETRSERILPTVERGELLEIPVEIAVSGEIRQLVDLLARIESSPKLIRVQDVKVRVMNVSQPKELLATMTLSGFIRPAKPKA